MAAPTTAAIARGATSSSGSPTIPPTCRCAWRCPSASPIWWSRSSSWFGRRYPLLGSGRGARRRAQLVADVAHRLDHGAAGAELGAQTAHVDVDGAGPARVAVTPHARQELLAAE